MSEERASVASDAAERWRTSHRPDTTLALERLRLAALVAGTDDDPRSPE